MNCRSIAIALVHLSVCMKINAQMEPHYEIFDHTADMGMHVYAPTMSALLVPAANGLYSMIGELATGEKSFVRSSKVPEKDCDVQFEGTSSSESAGTLTIDLAGDEPAVMLRDYLDELLVRFERDKRIAAAYETTELSEHRLRASIRLSAIDVPNSVYHREVKAITYHALHIIPIEGGFQATVIVDI